MQIDPGRGYDLIGDVHGCGDSLQQLLAQMGYRRQGGVWRHARRKVIFLGDIVDRGPHIREALHLVHDMVMADQAHCIMGNHELSALGWYTPAPTDSGKHFVREHNPRHTRLFKETLEQLAPYPEDWRGFREWFLELPLFLECADRFRVVHACWDHVLISQLQPRLGGNSNISLELVQESAREDSVACIALNRLLRGTDMPLPHGMTQVSQDGFVRSFFRAKFWEENPQTYGDVVFQPDGLPEEAAQVRLEESQKRSLYLYGKGEPILFVGHYWCTGTPGPIRPNLACLDYSAVRQGKLVAYRMDSEKQLDPHHFVWVDVGS